ncbi:hypothetical protein AX774_g5754, partial [Zancudomyces culisetae]
QQPPPQIVQPQPQPQPVIVQTQQAVIVQQQPPPQVVQPQPEPEPEPVIVQTQQVVIVEQTPPPFTVVQPVIVQPQPQPQPETIVVQQPAQPSTIIQTVVAQPQPQPQPQPETVFVQTGQAPVLIPPASTVVTVQAQETNPPPQIVFTTPAPAPVVVQTPSTVFTNIPETLIESEEENIVGNEIEESELDESEDEVSTVANTPILITVMPSTSLSTSCTTLQIVEPGKTVALATASQITLVTTVNEVTTVSTCTDSLTTDLEAGSLVGNEIEEEDTSSIPSTATKSPSAYNNMGSSLGGSYANNFGVPGDTDNITQKLSALSQLSADLTIPGDSRSSACIAGQYSCINNIGNGNLFALCGNNNGRLIYKCPGSRKCVQGNNYILCRDRNDVSKSIIFNNLVF